MDMQLWRWYGAFCASNVENLLYSQWINGLINITLKKSLHNFITPDVTDIREVIILVKSHHVIRDFIAGFITGLGSHTHLEQTSIWSCSIQNKIEILVGGRFVVRTSTTSTKMCLVFQSNQITFHNPNKKSGNKEYWYLPLVHKWTPLADFCHFSLTLYSHHTHASCGTDPFSQCFLCFTEKLITGCYPGPLYNGLSCLYRETKQWSWIVCLFFLLISAHQLTGWPRL